jgi:hypothetical protein
MLNLEPICARFGHNMICRDRNIQVKDQENVITKALGVLIECGLYSMCIFLLSCNKKDYGSFVLTENLKPLWQMDEIRLIPQNVGNGSADLLRAVQNMTNDFPKLVLARKITEQSLIFARYHAKADVTA